MLSLNPKALAALSSVLLGGALLVSGCGGGGGGATIPTATPIATATSGPTPTSTPSDVSFADEFNNGGLDTSKWSVLDRTHVIQRTEFGNQPTFAQDNDGTRFMRVNMDSYLPDDATRPTGVVQFYGTEVVAKTLIPRGTGVRYEARMRMAQPNQGGMVGSFFAFGQKGNFGGTPPLSFDELDHELLTNAFIQPSKYTWTNSYNDFRVPQPGVESGDRYDDLSKTFGEGEPFTTDYNYAGWNVYRMDWKPGQVQWFINDQLIRTDTTGRVPDDALGVRFNLWAATPAPIGWDAAFSDSLKPAQTPAGNQTYSMDVDWVRVSALPTTGVRAIAPRLLSQTDAQIQRGPSGPGYTKKR